MDLQYTASSIFANKVFEEYTKLGLRSYIAQEDAKLQKLEKSFVLSEKDCKTTHIQTQEELNAVVSLLSDLLIVIRGLLAANDTPNTCIALAETLEAAFWCQETGHFKPPTNLTSVGTR